ncbi:MAG: DUF4133 domain-containing protein [Pedobacter sp.]|nr:MAG: DUF4133 domain-containing protein [Pedobacter sp.]
MMRRYPFYKGLGKPLVYKGFKGKFIIWAIFSLLSGLIAGGLLTALAGAFSGLFSGIVLAVSGVSYTVIKQKHGLHNKKRHQGIFIHPLKLKLYEKKLL